MADIVRAGSLWGYCALVQSVSGDPDTLLAEVGLNARDLSDTDRYISCRAAMALLEITADELHVPDFGLRLAAVQDVYILGALAFALRNAPDLDSSLRTASRYLHIHAPTATLTIQPVSAGAEERIIVQTGLELPVTASQAHEHSVGLMCRILGLLTRGAVRPTRVHFRHEPVSSMEAYRTHLGVTPEFEMDADAAVVRTQDLRAPLSNADQHLRALVERFLDAHAPLASEHIGQHVHHVLSRLMRMGGATMADVADVLRVHPRTLQRKLSSQGATYEQVRDDVRKELAEVYLARDVIPISHVAHLLGYSDQSALTRSCLRWFGKTPMAIRRDHAVGPRVSA